MTVVKPKFHHSFALHKFYATAQNPGCRAAETVKNKVEIATIGRHIAVSTEHMEPELFNDSLRSDRRW
ncbi:hypothetical protein ACQKKX_09160 [Neorhizobium sp. NPDC001467]|uniref:hypothetical protein n=1 Tax=Neorhizobium sp. NPDC001467 TaxID=3390595 RepID=UPI003D02798B